MTYTNYKEKQVCVTLLHFQTSALQMDDELMMCLCFHILFSIYIVMLWFTNIHHTIWQPQIDTVQSDTDCDQDFIRPISYNVTCNKFTQSLLSHSVKVPLVGGGRLLPALPNGEVCSCVKAVIPCLWNRQQKSLMMKLLRFYLSNVNKKE